jgi:hypothetical protein
MTNQIITTGSFPKSLKPGVRAFTQMMYNQYKPIYTNMFNTTTSNMAYEELVAGNTFGLAPSKAQGSAISYQGESQANVTRSTHVTYATGFVVTLEEVEYNLYDKLSKRRSARLADSFTRTKETVGANVFNRGFNSSYTYGDGKELFSTSHPTVAGNQSNTLTTAADISEAAIEDLCIQIMNATDNVGNKIKLMPKSLGIAPANTFEATRILKSDKQNDTANNAVNAIKTLGWVPEMFVNTYFTDADAWFLFTDINADDGLTMFQSIPFRTNTENDSDTINMKFYGYEAYSFTTGDWRAVYGSPGI